MSHYSCNLEHELIADFLGDLEGCRIIGITHNLNHALAVAQVNKNDATMVAAAMHPAVKSYRPVEVFGVNKATVISAHELQNVEKKMAGSKNRTGQVFSLEAVVLERLPFSKAACCGC